MTNPSTTQAIPSPVDDPIATVRRLQPRLARALRRNVDGIVVGWAEHVPLEERLEHPDIDRQLRALVAGLCSVFERGDWSLLQDIIDGLASRRARIQGASDRGFQRALISGRQAIRPYLDTKDERDALIEALDECVFRYHESYQGVRIASENERLHTRIIRSLVMALEARDPYTKGHSLSVALLCEKIATLTRLADPRQAYLAGLLHDVGKVGIPDDILRKEAPLTDEEWVIMRAHPIMGANILSPIRLYADVVDGVLAHHENWDGTGYPTGRAGEEIPILGRMIRVVDTFDAMTTTRAFRASRSIAESLDEIRNLSGFSYDPTLVKALEKLVAEPEVMRDLSLAALEVDLANGI